MSTTNSYPTFATSVSNLSAFFRESAEKAMKEDDRTGLAPHMLMKILGISTLLAVTLPAPSVAEAKGCIKGAVVGVVAGHMVGHGKLGAAAGCAIGHHEAKKTEVNRTHSQQSRSDQK